jgi:hypothetical protein
LAGCSEPDKISNGYRTSSTQQSITDTNPVTLEGTIKFVQPHSVDLGLGNISISHAISFVYFVADDSSEHTIIQPYTAMVIPGKRARVSFYKINNGTISTGEFRSKFVSSAYESGISDSFIIEADGVIAPKGIKLLEAK